MVTDPVRQTYIWKELGIDLFKEGVFPSWNPYEMAGKPLAANFQTAAFYPLNIVFLISPFYFSWSIFIVSQSFMAILFLYLYLRNLKLGRISSSVGAIAFGFSGYSISWLEWGNIVSTALWLPLILLSIDRMFDDKKRIYWHIIYIFSISSSLFAGHLQTFFYVLIVTIFYFTYRWIVNKKDRIILLKMFFSSFISFLLTSIQWYPTLRFINLSSRSLDQNFREVEGWFLPWQNIIQFIAPDFFGNPSTLNYFGVWNYGEFVGYISIASLVFALVSLLRPTKDTLFFLSLIILSLLFSLPTGVSSLPFVLEIPFISSAQPSRLIFVIVFSLCILTAIGFDIVQKTKFSFKKKNLLPVAIIGIVLILLWIFSSLNIVLFSELGQNEIAKRNLILPTVVFTISSFLFILYLKNKSVNFRKVILFFILVVISVDLLRFAQKYTPFSEISYLYPKTKTIQFLNSQQGVFRTATLDRRIMAPNFFTHYKIQSIEGYDPLYLQNYADFIAVMEQNSTHPSKPYGFNRIITPHNYKSQLFDFLNTKYVLSIDEITDPKFDKIFEEGLTKVYLNKQVFERAFFVEEVRRVEKDDVKNLLDGNLDRVAYVVEYVDAKKLAIGKVEVVEYFENQVVIRTQNEGDGFLIISDTYYPTWSAFIDGESTEIYKTNHAFRGIYVPKGNHTIVMKNSPF